MELKLKCNELQTMYLSYKLNSFFKSFPTSSKMFIFYIAGIIWKELCSFSLQIIEVI